MCDIAAKELSRFGGVIESALDLSSTPKDKLEVYTKLALAEDAEKLHRYSQKAGGTLKTCFDIQRLTLELLAEASSMKLWWGSMDKETLHTMDAPTAKRISDFLKLSFTLKSTIVASGSAGHVARMFEPVSMVFIPSANIVTALLQDQSAAIVRECIDHFVGKLRIVSENLRGWIPSGWSLHKDMLLDDEGSLSYHVWGEGGEGAVAQIPGPHGP